MRRWGLVAVACAVAGSVLLGGCAERQEAGGLPAVSSSPGTTTAALPPLGPPDFPMPAEAREKTAEGFNAFADYYLGLINHLSTELDPTFLRQFSRNCETCNRIAGDAETDAVKGYRYEGGTITVTSWAPAHVAGDTAEMAFLADQEEYTVRDATGAVVPDLIGEALERVSSGIAGEWDPSTKTWIVTNLTFG